MLVNRADHRIEQNIEIQFNVRGSIITLISQCFVQPSAAENNQEGLASKFY